jgi:hypothetical protein
LNGMCLYEGRKHWFRLLVEDEDTRDRTFEIVELTDEEIEAIDQEQALFEKYVGSHTRYDEHNKRNHELVLPHVDWPKYYDSKKTLPELSGKVVKIVSEDELRAIDF